MDGALVSPSTLPLLLPIGIPTPFRSKTPRLFKTPLPLELVCGKTLCFFKMPALFRLPTLHLFKVALFFLQGLIRQLALPDPHLLSALSRRFVYLLEFPFRLSTYFMFAFLPRTILCKKLGDIEGHFFRFFKLASCRVKVVFVFLWIIRHMLKTWCVFFTSWTATFSSFSPRIRAIARTTS